jgi:hypothetical protein
MKQSVEIALNLNGLLRRTFSSMTDLARSAPNVLLAMTFIGNDVIIN